MVGDWAGCRLKSIVGFPSIGRPTHKADGGEGRREGGRAGACCACAMCPSVPPCKDTLTIPLAPTNRRPDRLTSTSTDPTTCLLIQHPTPRQLTQQASYVLYESASGYGLFEVVQHDDIASLTEEVCTGLLALCWLVFTWRHVDGRARSVRVWRVLCCVSVRACLHVHQAVSCCRWLLVVVLGWVGWSGGVTRRAWMWTGSVAPRI